MKNRRRGFDDRALAARAGALGGAKTPHHKRAFWDQDKAKEAGRRGGMAGRGAKKVAAGRLGGLACNAKHRHSTSWREQKVEAGRQGGLARAAKYRNDAREQAAR